MYRQFYGLSAAVFDKALPPEKFYRGKAFTEALARLEYAVSTREIMALVGEIGTGKTSLVRALREKLADGKHKLAYVGNPTIKARGVLSAAAYQLGLEVGFSLPKILRELTRHLVELKQRGHAAVIVFDVPRLVAFISRMCTLEPGDLIAVGVSPGPTTAPDREVLPGDTIEGTIQGIGTLRNKIARTA